MLFLCKTEMGFSLSIVESVPGKVAFGSEMKGSQEKGQMVLRGLSVCSSHSPRERVMWHQVEQEQGSWRGGGGLQERFKRPNDQDLAINSMEGMFRNPD